MPERKEVAHLLDDEEKVIEVECEEIISDGRVAHLHLAEEDKVVEAKPLSIFDKVFSLF